MRWIFWGVLTALVALARFAHLGVLWVEEAYPTAAARELLAGQTLYRDVWFDKPPLFAGIYTLWGAQTGWPLRLAGTLFVLLCCAVAYRFGSRLWNRQAGELAAALLAFFLTFGMPAAIMALTPDLLMIPLHLGAVLLAISGWPLAAGAAVGLALLFNSKALVVLAVCLLWQWRSALRMMAGFIFVQATACGWLAANGSLPAYWDQVWVWGSMYSRFPLSSHPLAEGLRRTLNWLGFHAAVVVPAVWFAWRAPDRWKWIAWLLFSLAAVWLGFRYFPRYFFQILPVVCLLGARGLTALPGNYRIACLALLLVPFLRFAPAHWKAATHDPAWSDLALYRDSIDAAGQARALGDTLFVWGYRPELYPLSGLRAGTPFLDSQPVSGVLADRHLVDSTVSAPEWRRRNLPRLQEATPAVVIDGLGKLNPALGLDAQPELATWLRGYTLVGESRLSLIYQRR